MLRVVLPVAVALGTAGLFPRASCANLTERKSSKNLVEAERRDIRECPCPVAIPRWMVNPLSRH